MKKKCTRFALLFFLAVALCSVSALAAGEGGVYNVEGSDNVSITPQTAEGTTISEQTSVDDKEVYMDAARFDVAVTNADATKQYLILVTEGSAVPTVDNIVYIDQKAGSELPFNAYPSSLAEGSYSVWLASSDAGVTAGSPAGSFEYYVAFLLGYVDDDADITAADAQWTLQISVGNRDATSKQRRAADVDKDGEVTAADAQWILQSAVGSRTFS